MSAFTELKIIIISAFDNSKDKMQVFKISILYFYTKIQKHIMFSQWESAPPGGNVHI